VPDRWAGVSATLTAALLTYPWAAGAPVSRRRTRLPVPARLPAPPGAQLPLLSRPLRFYSQISV